MIRKILAQATKEWRLFRRDKLLIVLAIVMPVIFMALAGLTSSLKLRNVKLLVYDYDNTPLSRTYLETYGAAITFVLVPHKPDESPEFALASGHGRAALIIPQNFQRDVRRGAEPIVQLMIDASDSNAATSLGNTAQALNTNFGRNTGIGWAQQRQVAQLDNRLWYNPGLSNPIYFGTGGLGIMLILFPALLGALATAKEYEMGTIIQAYASSLHAAQWIAGKALVYVLIGIVEFLICFTLGMVAFSYNIPTDPSVLLVATILYLFAGVFFGMIMGNATGSQSAAIQGVQMGSFLLSLLLSGYLFAISNIPVQIRWLSSFLPATHYIQIVRNSILRDVGWSTSFRPMAALAGLALAFFIVNLMMMRKMQFKA